MFYEIFLGSRLCEGGLEPQINYIQIVNVFSLHNRIEPSAVLYWALGVVQCTRACLETVDPAAG